MRKLIRVCIDMAMTMVESNVNGKQQRWRLVRQRRVRAGTQGTGQRVPSSALFVGGTNLISTQTCRAERAMVRCAEGRLNHAQDARVRWKRRVPKERAAQKGAEHM
jgi:hypothetical protein